MTGGLFCADMYSLQHPSLEKKKTFSLIVGITQIISKLEMHFLFKGLFAGVGTPHNRRRRYKASQCRLARSADKAFCQNYLCTGKMQHSIRTGIY